MLSPDVNWEYVNEFNKTLRNFLLRKKAVCRSRSLPSAARLSPEFSESDSVVDALCSLL